MTSDAFTVGQLNELIAAALELTFPDEVWVVGEIASLSRRPSGHVFFQLVDPGPAGTGPVAALDVALFAGARRRVNDVLRASGAVRMGDGVQLRVRGRIDYYPPQGRLRLVMSEVDPEYTLGRLAAERERVRRLLATEGLLGANGALPFPVAPRRIGLVTSPGSAAHADVMAELTRSGLGWQVVLAEATVQGRGATTSLVAALTALGGADVEVIVVARGGGARTDLAAFDHEAVARAIAAAPVPVVTGIGHEIDRAVADEVASRAYKTPTAAAASLVDHVRAALARADAAGVGIGHHARRALDRAARDLRAADHRAALATARSLEVAEERQRLHAARLVRAASVGLTDADRRLTVAAARTDALDPARALARGWSITRTADGRVVRDLLDAPAGTHLLTTVAAGSIRSTVDPGGPTEGADLPTATAAGHADAAPQPPDEHLSA